jgi:DNA-binding transcriptional LysR family regulator
MPQFLAAMAAASRSDAVVTLPRGLAARFAAAFGLTLHSPPFALPGFDLAALRHRQTDGDPAVDWLQALLSRLLKGSRQSPDGASAQAASEA